MSRAKDGTQAQLAYWIPADLKAKVAERAKAEGRPQIKVLLAALDRYLAEPPKEPLRLPKRGAKRRRPARAPEPTST